MHILLLTQYFPPETGATQNRLAALVRDCREDGITVTVLTAMPHYPSCRVFPGYRRRFIVRESFLGATVIRCWLWAHGAGRWGRLASFLTFAVTALLFGLMRVRKVDLVLCESPPLFTGLAAISLARLKRARLVTNVADLWVTSLTELGLLGGGIATRALKALERELYRRSNLISGQTEAMAAAIRRCTPGTPVVHWENGADEIPLPSGSPKTDWRSQWDPSGCGFIVGYAGVFGFTQGLEVVVDAANLVDTATFVFIGSGPLESALRAKAERLGLGNIIWVPRQRHEEMPEIWAALDCLVIPLRDIPSFRGTVPSKVYEAMAAGKPLLLMIAGEAAEIVTQADAGLVIPPEDVAGLAAAIQTLRDNPALRERLGRNGREAVRRLYNRRILNRTYIKTLRSVVEKPRASGRSADAGR